MKRAWLAPVIVALGAIALAQASSAGGDVTVTQATVQGQMQQVLATSTGMTLYYSSKDTPNKSNCTGTCAQSWKPYTISGKSVKVGGGSQSATAGAAGGNSSSAAGGSSNGAAAGMAGASSLKSSDFTTITTNGKNQVVYEGHPLYTYSKDTKPGDANGAGQSSFHVATPNTPKASGGSTLGGSSSGGAGSSNGGAGSSNGGAG
ncbi:MAG TPA: hypothetical protein VKB31_04870 [Trueperaceae bacterium]|nr:hypothetical protein [Trueperaceae bacterium]